MPIVFSCHFDPTNSVNGAGKWQGCFNKIYLFSTYGCGKLYIHGLIFNDIFVFR